MPRLILFCPYLKPDAKRAGYLKYIATRDGVEMLPPECKQLPATQKQQELAAQLLRDFPSAGELFEYEDYAAQPTAGNASTFIAAALEHHAATGSGKDKYIQYIAERLGAEKLSGHGLFGMEETSVALAKTARELDSHPGNVWLPILSLRRKDAMRLGYDNAAHWRDTLRAHSDDLAKAMKIAPEHFRWVAAFHDEGHHPHVHMMCWSTDAREGFLTERGMEQIKSTLARNIFAQDLISIYQRQTEQRQHTGEAAQETLRRYVEEMQGGTLENPKIDDLMLELSEKMRAHTGKAVYGYLRPPLKALVDAVVDELAKDERVAGAYAAWCESRHDVLSTYSKKEPDDIPLSQQKEFKSVRNMVVRTAVDMAAAMGELAAGFNEPSGTDAQSMVYSEPYSIDATPAAGGIPSQTIYPNIYGPSSCAGAGCERRRGYRRHAQLLYLAVRGTKYREGTRPPRQCRPKSDCAKCRKVRRFAHCSLLGSGIGFEPPVW